MVAESALKVLWRLRPILAVAEHPELIQSWRQDFVHVPVQLSKEALAQLHTRSIHTFSTRSYQSDIEFSSIFLLQCLGETECFLTPTNALPFHLRAEP